MKRYLNAFIALTDCRRVDAPAGEKRIGQTVGPFEASICGLAPRELEPKEDALELRFKTNSEENSERLRESDFDET